MSPSQRRALVSRVSRVSSRIVFGLVLASIVGCHQRGVRPKPTSAETVSDGYGEKSKDQVGGAVQSVTFDDGPNKRVSRVEELIEGRFSGVLVQRTANGGYSVSIRGTGSFSSSEQPLYVIDGMPYEVGSGRGLGWLNPADVVRIDLLKNPAETSIYGVRGANGVIVITTKRKP